MSTGHLDGRQVRQQETVTTRCHRAKPELPAFWLLNSENGVSSHSEGGPREWPPQDWFPLARTQEQPLPGGQDWPPCPDYSEQWRSWWRTAQLLLRLVIFTLWSLLRAYVLTYSRPAKALGVLTPQLLFNTLIYTSALCVHAGLRHGETSLSLAVLRNSTSAQEGPVGPDSGEPAPGALQGL